VFGGGIVKMELFRGLIVILVLICSLVLATPASATRGPAITSRRDEGRTAAKFVQADGLCPLDFSILSKYTWIKDVCRLRPAVLSNTTDANRTCCIAALSGIGLALAEHLRVTGLFGLRDKAMVNACLSSFQTQLKTTGVTRNVAKECFVNASTGESNPFLFTRGPLMCQGIQTKADFQRVAGTKLGIDLSSCEGDLGNDGQCTLCVKEIQNAVTLLTNFNVSTSPDCFDYVILYSAGVVNLAGPWDSGTSYCLLAVATDRDVSSGSSIHCCSSFEGPRFFGDGSEEMMRNASCFGISFPVIN
jgi:hypothetical protein